VLKPRAFASSNVILKGQREREKGREGEREARERGGGGERER